ncbi:MAG: ribosome biogenesis GTPase Der [Deltaproteobacteria bacterium]
MEDEQIMNPVVAIVGRPNVGKSTLFNRLSRSRDALVDDQPGITRDRLYALVQWGKHSLTLIDTGGLEVARHEPLSEQVKEQVVKAIEEADKIIFMVDGREGIMPSDEDIAHLLRRSQKDVLLAVNKIDGPEHDHLVSDFYRLGLHRAYPLSAAHGYGLKALMEDLVIGLPEPETDARDDDRIRVAIVGKPNVGKSSLVNRILGSDRLLVSEVPGTTRDAVDTPFSLEGKAYLLIDTAGIRRKARVKEKIEKFSMIKALRTLDRCHVAVIVLDAQAGVAEQDARICGYAHERHRAVIRAANKWDLVKQDVDKRRRLSIAMERQLKFLSFAPRVHLSALTGEGVMDLLKQVEQLYEQYSRRISTGAVNRAVSNMILKRPPPEQGRRRLKVFYATQVRTRPPTFVVFVNRPEMMHFSYQRFMINRLRDSLGLHLTPVKLILKKKE